MAKVLFSMARGEEDLRDLSMLHFHATMEGSAMPFFLERRADTWRIMGVRGEDWDIIIARRSDDGRCVAYGTLAHRRVHTAGGIRRVTNLVEMFFHPSIRGGIWLARAFRHLKEVAFPDGFFAQAQVALSNGRAMEAFTSGRGGLPGFYPFGRGAFHSIPLRRDDARLPSDLEVRRARPEDLPALQAFHDEWAPSRRLYPRYDFSRLDDPYYRGLVPGDFFLAFRGGRPVGMAGVWDQHSFKAIHYLRVLPDREETTPGERFLFLHSLLAAPDSPEAIGSLAAAILAEYRDSIYRHVFFALDEADPWRAGLERFEPEVSLTQHFLVSFDGDPRPEVGAGLFYLEAARG